MFVCIRDMEMSQIEQFNITIRSESIFKSSRTHLAVTKRVKENPTQSP